MLSVHLGPFAFPFTMLVVLVGGVTAALVGYLVGRRDKIGIVNVLSDMLVVGVIVARISFVAIWFDSYRSPPWSVLDIRDGGFMLWPGIAAAALVAAWQAWRQPARRKPLAVGLASGVAAAGLVFALLRSEPPAALPTTALTTLDGDTVTLSELAEGKPMVVNMWASWCPPCRREMPVLAAAQQAEPGVRFVFVNQGEDRAAVAAYLGTLGLTLDHVVLDEPTALGQDVGSAGLPTTLFYDAHGRRVDTHLGGLSTASLNSKLSALRPPADAAANRRAP